MVRDPYRVGPSVAGSSVGVVTVRNGQVVKPPNSTYVPGTTPNAANASGSPVAPVSGPVHTFMDTSNPVTQALGSATLAAPVPGVAISALDAAFMGLALVLGLVGVATGNAVLVVLGIIVGIFALAYTLSKAV